jgi:hypothetical protein
MAMVMAMVGVEVWVRESNEKEGEKGGGVSSSLTQAIVFVHGMGFFGAVTHPDATRSEV